MTFSRLFIILIHSYDSFPFPTFSTTEYLQDPPAGKPQPVSGADIGPAELLQYQRQKAMSAAIRLLCDKYILLPDLPEKISVFRFDPVGGIPADAGSYDALLVRTVSRIDGTTLPDRPEKLRFIGSATAGTDHVDREWLADRGIEFAWSPGCNARSVGEYTSVALLAWSLMTGADLSSLVVGIVGAGHTGEAVARLLNRLHIPCRKHDPPRAERDPDFSGCSLDDVLGCDVLTFHTPLTQKGRWPTRHWLEREKLENRNFRLIINAARGGVIDEQALFAARRAGSVEHYILDVWENEPLFNDQVARHALFTTPHIAGYSIQAKQRATSMVLESLYRFFELPLPAGTPDGRKTPATPGSTAAHASSLPFFAGRNAPPPAIGEAGIQPDLLKMIFRLNPFGEYDKRFKPLIGMDSAEKARAFQELRSRYPLRHEHPFCHLDPAVLETYPVLAALCFRPE